MLTKSHQETRDRLKSLKASKTNICRKRKSSSKAESNSSGRVRSTTIFSSATAKVTKAAKFGSKKGTLVLFANHFKVFFHLITQLKSIRGLGRIQFPHRWAAVRVLTKLRHPLPSHTGKLRDLLWRRQIFSWNVRVPVERCFRWTGWMAAYLLVCTFSVFFL